MQNELFNKAGDSVGTEEITERDEVTRRLTEQELLRVYQGRERADNGEALTEYTPPCPEHSCECNAGLTRRNYSKKPCQKCGAFANRAAAVKEKYAERGNKNRVTCVKLFCNGEKDSDGFSRTIALRYLTKRIVYGQGRGKGKESVKTQVEGKASSSQHSPKWCAAHEIEDICQDAFLIFWEQKVEGKLHGDTFRDTTRACRTALTLALRARQKQGKAIDYRRYTLANKERSKDNARYLDLSDTLLNAVKQEGSAKQEDIARALGCSQPTAYRMLRKQREALTV